MVAFACHFNYTENINRRVTVQARLGIKSETLLQKMPEAQRAGGLDQVVEHLPSKLSSNFSTTKERDREKEKRLVTKILKDSYFFYIFLRI
jgi:hypothetical protein